MSQQPRVKFCNYLMIQVFWYIGQCRRVKCKRCQSVRLCVCLLVRMEQLGSPRRIFMKYGIGDFY
jgi:hypothetical protein